MPGSEEEEIAAARAAGEFPVRICLDSPDASVHSAICVSEGSVSCTRSSGVHNSEDVVFRWIAEHVRATGHSAYHRTSAFSLHAEPLPGPRFETEPG